MKPIAKRKPKSKNILKEIKHTIDSGELKKEGNVSIANVKNSYKVKRGKDIIHEGSEFKIAYDFFLKLVLGKL